MTNSSFRSQEIIYKEENAMEREHRIQSNKSNE